MQRRKIPWDENPHVIPEQLPLRAASEWGHSPHEVPQAGLIRFAPILLKSAAECCKLILKIPSFFKAGVDMSEKKSPKFRKAKNLVILFIVGIAAFFMLINLIPPKKNTEHNPFLVPEGNLPMLAAHRGGAINYPENTMLAYREAVESVGVDVIESDLYLTADGILVCNHNSDIDETSNVNGDIPLESIYLKSERHFIADMTLEDLRQYNFGFYFKDKNGERPYKDAHLEIPTLDELFSAFYENHPDLLFILEIKEGGERGREACKKLGEVIAKYPDYADNVVIGTFNEEIELALKEECPSLLRGASEGSAADFVITQYARVNLFNKSDFACLQLPTSYDVGINVPLDKKTLVDRAHRRGIAVQYWTINDEETMRKLIELGCDCIMTDDPQLLKAVLEEYR